MKRDYFFDPAALLRYRHRPPLEVYAAERIREIAKNGADIRVERVTDFDDVLLKQANGFVKQVADTLGGSFGGFFGKYQCEVTIEGYPLKGYFASINAYKKGQQQSAPASSGGGFLGGLMNTLGSFSGALGAMGAPDWARCYDIVLFVQNEELSAYNKIFNDFAASIQYGSLYYALCDDELRSTEQVQLQGARDRQRIAFEGAQRVRQIQNQTSDIINRGYEQRSWVTDDIGRKRSEAIRGVNSYTTTYGDTVEASVSYDRVFQKGYDTFIATDRGDLTLGPDWIELKRND